MQSCKYLLFRTATIIKDGENLGMAYSDHTGPPTQKQMEEASIDSEYDSVNQRIRERAESNIMTAFAGVAAELLLSRRRKVWPHWHDTRIWLKGGHEDLKNARLWSSLVMPSDPEQEAAYLEWLWIRTRGMLGGNWFTVEAVADYLLQHHELRAKDWQRALEVRMASGRPGVAPFFAAVIGSIKRP